MEAVVLAVDPERERISLGLKQATSDPFTAFVQENGKGSIVTGVVETVDAKGAIIVLTDTVEGYLRAAELTHDHVEDARSFLKEGDTVEAKITSIERKNRRISLSVKARDVDIEGEAIQEYGRNVPTGSTLGDKLKEQLSKTGG